MHIIHRQIVNTSVIGTQADGLAVQQQMAEMMQSAAYMRALETVLNEFDNEASYLEIPRLVLDVGQFSGLDFEPQLIEKITELLRAEVQEKIADADSLGLSATFITAQQAEFEALMLYLRTGYAPAEGAEYIREVLESGTVNFFKNWSQAQWQIFLTVIKEHQVQQRFLHQFSKMVVRVVLEKATDAAFNWIAYDAFVASPKVSFQVLSKVLFNLCAAENWEAIRTISNAFEIENRVSKDDVLAFLSEVTPSNEADTAVAIYLKNAGMVLLHPFVPMCFEALGWIQAGQFINLRAQQKAMLMWHFLATGQAAAIEPELVLPKILCGLPIGFAKVSGKLKLNKKEQSEGTALLEAAVSHWAALKNTSPDGLREAFLQREGKLEPNNAGGWTLTIEQRAQDILLERLPYGWGIGRIQFGWMHHMLQVDWG